MQPSTQPSSSPTKTAPKAADGIATWTLVATSGTPDAPINGSVLDLCAPSHWASTFQRPGSCSVRAAVSYCFAGLPSDTACSIDMDHRTNVTLTAGAFVFNPAPASLTNVVKVLVNGNGATFSAAPGHQGSSFFVTNNTAMQQYSSFLGHRRLFSASSSVLILQNVTLKGFGSSGVNGGALNLFGLTLLSLTDVTFVDNEGANGGAIYVCNTTEVVLKNVVFRNNRASSNGGAIFLSNVDIVTINGAKFYLNTASNIGGAAVIDSSMQLVLKGSTFSGNSASQFGGALAVNGVRMSTHLVNSRWIGNTAHRGSAFVLRGVHNDQQKGQNFSIVDNEASNNVASLAGTFYWIQQQGGSSGSISTKPIMSGNTYENNAVGGRVGYLDFATEAVAIVPNPALLVFEDYRPGVFPLSLKASIVDAYEQVIISENNSLVVLSMLTSPGSASCGYNTAYKMSGALMSTSLVGVATFDGFSAHCTPGGKMNATLVATIGPSSIAFPDYSSSYVSASTQEFLPREVYNTAPLHIEFRRCIQGEYFDILDTRSNCIECTDSYSFLDNSDNSVTSCKDCPALSQTCYGDTIILEPGTWRWSEHATTIFECPYPAGCLGGNATGQASCALGYQGALCGVCSEHYYTSSNGDECLPCTGSGSISSSQIFIIAVIGAFLFIFVSILVFQNLNDAILGTSESANDVQEVKKEKDGYMSSCETFCCSSDVEMEKKEITLLKRIAGWLTPGPRVKIAIATYQIVLQTPFTFRISFGPYFSGLVAAISVINFNFVKVRRRQPARPMLWSHHADNPIIQ